MEVIETSLQVVKTLSLLYRRSTVPLQTILMLLTNFPVVCAKKILLYLTKPCSLNHHLEMLQIHVETTCINFSNFLCRRFFMLRQLADVMVFKFWIKFFSIEQQMFFQQYSCYFNFFFKFEFNTFSLFFVMIKESNYSTYSCKISNT